LKFFTEQKKIFLVIKNFYEVSLKKIEKFYLKLIKIQKYKFIKIDENDEKYILMKINEIFLLNYEMIFHTKSLLKNEIQLKKLS
jgi:hypothetical protein